MPRRLGHNNHVPMYQQEDPGSWGRLRNTKGGSPLAKVSPSTYEVTKLQQYLSPRKTQSTAQEATCFTETGDVSKGFRHGFRAPGGVGEQ